MIDEKYIKSLEERLFKSSMLLWTALESLKSMLLFGELPDGSVSDRYDPLNNLIKNLEKAIDEMKNEHHQQSEIQGLDYEKLKIAHNLILKVPEKYSMATYVGCSFDTYHRLYALTSDWFEDYKDINNLISKLKLLCEKNK